MELKTILKELYAGKKLTISFANSKDREAFRQRLYKLKQTQDKALTDILDEERQELRCQLIDVIDAGETSIEEEPPKARFWLESKPSQEFEVTIEPE